MALLRIRKPDGEIVEIACLPGQGVPEVTVDDDGKTLLVVDGEWAAADLPMATLENLGAVRVHGPTQGHACGLVRNAGGVLMTAQATEALIDARENTHTPITPANLDYAVKSVGDGYYATVENIGDIEAEIDELRAYVQSLVSGGATE